MAVSCTWAELHEVLSKVRKVTARTLTFPPHSGPSTHFSGQHGLLWSPSKERKPCCGPWRRQRALEGLTKTSEVLHGIRMEDERWTYIGSKDMRIWNARSNFLYNLFLTAEKGTKNCVLHLLSVHLFYLNSGKNRRYTILVGYLCSHTNPSKQLEFWKL